MIQVVIAPAHLAGKKVVVRTTWADMPGVVLDDWNQPADVPCVGVFTDAVRLARLPADRLPRLRELLGTAPEPGDAAWAAAVVGAVNEPMVRA